MLIMLLVNNDNGGSAGRLKGIHIGEMLELDGPKHNPILCQLTSDRISIGGRLYNCSNYGRHSGNTHWHACEMSPDEAAQLVDDLWVFGFVAIAGDSWLVAKYQSNAAFTPADFAEASV